MAKQDDKIQAMVNDIDPATRKVIQRPLIDIVRENSGMIGVLETVIKLFEKGINTKPDFKYSSRKGGDNKNITAKKESTLTEEQKQRMRYTGMEAPAPRPKRRQGIME